MIVSKNECQLNNVMLELSLCHSPGINPRLRVNPMLNTMQNPTRPAMPIQYQCVSGTSNENQNCFVFDDEKVKSTTNTVSGIARTDRIVSVKSCHSLALLEFIQEIYINKLELKEVIGKAAIPIPYYCMCNNQLKFVWIPIFVFFLLCHNTPQHTIQKSTASFHLFRSEIHLLE